MIGVATFYDGCGIPGEIGDTIQLEESAQTAVVLATDLTANALTLVVPVTCRSEARVAPPGAMLSPAPLTPPAQ